MIATVTLNPMLDKTVRVDALPPGRITRANGLSSVVGGKGINVSRELRMLGVETLATGFVGGEIGVLLERLLDEEGIAHRFVRVAGMTREGVTYLDSQGVMTSVFEPPHAVTETEAARLIEECAAIAASSAWIVCGGSSPCPAADGVYAEIVARGHGAGARVLLDSYGEALRRGADARPDFLKPNKQEFETTFGGDLRTPRDMAGAAMMLIARGASYAIVSDGPRPFAAAHGGAAWLVTPPAVEPVDPTGSGDTMIAAVLWALSERRPFPECLAIGAAAGAANARAREVARVPRAAIESLIGTVRVERVGA